MPADQSPYDLCGPSEGEELFTVKVRRDEEERGAKEPCDLVDFGVTPSEARGRSVGDLLKGPRLVVIVLAQFADGPSGREDAIQRL